MAIDLAASHFPNWEESAQSWDECYLGGVLMPGAATISGLSCGPKLDKQNRRGREGTKLADDGMKPAKFSIGLTMIARHWPEWCEVLPVIYSIKPKAQRSPLPIVHPLPNSMGIDVVYVIAVKPSDPTPAGIFKVELEVEQWFAELPAVNGNTGKKATVSSLLGTAKTFAESDAGKLLGAIGANLLPLPPAGPLLTSLIYSKPEPPPEDKQPTRGDSGTGGASGASGKR